MENTYTLYQFLNLDYKEITVNKNIILKNRVIM
jgi:hypothetical protein